MATNLAARRGNGAPLQRSAPTQPSAATGGTIATLLQDPRVVSQMALALPKHMTAERLARIALTEVRKNPQLAKADQASFLGAIMQCAALGLEPGGALGHAYLIPYGREVQFIIGYRGMIDLARRSGQILSIEAHVVHEADSFSCRLGLDPDLQHEPAWDAEDPGELRFVYAVAKLKDGGTQFEVMSRAQIEAIRKRSKASGGGPWKTDFEAMAKKGLALDTPIPTSKGWKPMGDIQKGDLVFDRHGKPTSVLAVSEIKNLPCFRVTFSNGDSIICDDEHRWIAKWGDNNISRKDFDVHTVNELYDAKRQGHRVMIPVQGPLDLPEADLPLDPYLLGYWLGDGTSRRASITCSSEDLAHVVQAVESAGFTPGAIRKDARADAFNVGVTNGLLNTLRELDLIQNKHVPPQYLRASHHQRLRLLQGLIDSDGHIDKARGRASFSTTSQCLADAVAELAASLGECVHRRTYLARGFGVETIAHHIGWTPSLPCATLARKACRLRSRQVKPYRAIKSIERIASVPTRCIAVDSPTESYLAGKSMAVTHNTVIRQLFKYLPVSIELAQAVGYDEQADLGAQDNPLAHLVSAAPAPEALPEATAKSATVATPVISAEQLETLAKGISRRLSAIGESAMFRETTEALGIDGLELLPVDQFDVVMGMLANADICRNWNEGSASNGAALLSPEDIEALQVAETEAAAPAPAPQPVKGKVQPAPAPADAKPIPGLPDEDDDQGEFL